MCVYRNPDLIPDLTFAFIPSLPYIGIQGRGDYFYTPDTTGIPRVTEPITRYLHAHKKYQKQITMQVASVLRS
jgi:hypothetical protein